MAPRHDSNGRISTNTSHARKLEAVSYSGGEYTPPAAWGSEARGLLVGVAGDVKVDVADNESGDNPVILPLPKGWNPVAVTKVYESGTTATGVWAYK